jgi:Putative auto-transporter adhesin, head GIN domain
MRILILAAALPLLVASPASSADRNFSVTSFTRIRVDGPYRLRVTTGVAPFATASGSSHGLDAVAIDVQGTTLVVHSNGATWGGYPGESPGPVEIAIGTHDLTAAWVNGSGSLDIDAVRGLSFDLSIQGSGNAMIDRVAVDQLRVGLSGAASARLAGQAAQVTAIVRGSSSLDGSALAAKNATVGAEGPSIVQVNVRDTIKIDARGTAAVTLTGGAACTVKAIGSASVAGCR